MSLATPSSAFNEIDHSNKDTGPQESAFGNLVSLASISRPADTPPGTPQEKDSGNFDFTKFLIPTDRSNEKTENTTEQKDPIDTEKYKNKVFDAWEDTKTNDKYFLFMADSEYCGFCDRTETALKDPKLAKFSDKFVTSISDPDVDPDSEFFINKFEIKKYPTMLLLKPQIDKATGKVLKVDLVGRMTGEQTASGMDEYFTTALRNYEKQKSEELSRSLIA